MIKVDILPLINLAEDVLFVFSSHDQEACTRLRSRVDRSELLDQMVTRPASSSL
jgi:hypothetical protein